MTTNVNRQITLASRPVDYPVESDFNLVEAPIPEPQEGEVLVQAIWLSLDPYMRGRMRDVRSYATPVELDQVMVGGVAGRVIRSRTPALAEGDIVEGPLGWQEYAISDESRLRMVDQGLGPLSTALGVLGMPGMTAYFGFLHVGQPRPGDTVVSTPAGKASSSSLLRSLQSTAGRSNTCPHPIGAARRRSCRSFSIRLPPQSERQHDCRMSQ